MQFLQFTVGGTLSQIASRQRCAPTAEQFCCTVGRNHLPVSLFYMPISISADKDAIYVNRSLKIKTITMANVKSVRLCPPTMGAIRICGSGGFFGYWGWFKERDLGKYFAYYGRLSEFLLFLLPHRWFIGHH